MDYFQGASDKLLTVMSFNIRRILSRATKQNKINLNLLVPWFLKSILHLVSGVTGIANTSDHCYDFRKGKKNT